MSKAPRRRATTMICATSCLPTASARWLALILGSPFPPAVYIGHPGLEVGGRPHGLSLATGVVIALVCFLKSPALLLAVVPLVAILPILLYIGLVIGAQAFQASPSKHAPAVVLAIISEYCCLGSDPNRRCTQRRRHGSATQLGLDKLMGTGVVYHGMQLLGGGAVLAGLMLGAIAAFIIEREFMKAGGLFARRGAVLSFFGFIHGTSLGIGNSAPVAVGYLIVAGVCYGLSRQGYPETLISTEEEPAHALGED